MFELLEDAFDQYTEDYMDNGRGTIDIGLSDGVMNIVTNEGTWVINKHSHTRQIWLSSPVSGPSKYNWHADISTVQTVDGKKHFGQNRQWLGERDDHSLHDRLTDQFSALFGLKFDFQEPF